MVQALHDLDYAAFDLHAKQGLKREYCLAMSWLLAPGWHDHLSSSGSVSVAALELGSVSHMVCHCFQSLRDVCRSKMLAQRSQSRRIRMV